VQIHTMKIPWIAALACGALAACGAAGAASLGSPLVVVDDQHVDVEVPFSGGQWNLHVNAWDDGPMPADCAILHLNKSTRTTRDAYESWIGAEGGQTIWVAAQDSAPGQLYLGLAARGCDSLGSWLPNDARLKVTFSYIQVALVDVRGYDGDDDPANNPPAPGHFALWTTSGSGVKPAWMSPAESLPDGNYAYMIPGGHAHYSWAFTAPGLYEVDFQARAYLGPGMTHPITSEPVTFCFGVERPWPGDANLDDRVDQEDAAILAAHWLDASPEVGWLEGDFNNDRAVDDLDASILAAHWAHAPASAAAVPEPPLGAMALGSALAAWAIRARKGPRSPGKRSPR